MIRSKWHSILVAILLMASANVFATNTLPSVAFFYGASVPVEQLSFYDQVVVEPSHLEAAQLDTLQRSGSSVFAYLSLGEVNAPLWRQYQLPDDLIVGRNRGWNSYIIDQASDEWQRFVLEGLIPPLVQAGYDGLFLDTLDSYQQVFRNEARQQPQRAALIDLILSIRQRYPALKLFMNRGFDLFPDIAPATDGMAVESLLRQFDPLNNTFSERSQDEQAWLLNQLEPVRRRNIPVTVIEYLSEYQPDQARDLADRLIEQGFSPWISTPELDILGTGLFSPSPRRVLMLYNDAEDPEQSDIHGLVAVIAEYLGLVPVYVHVDGALPDDSLVGRYAGIISWLDSEPANPRHFQQWLGKQLDDRVPLLFMNSLPLSDPLLLKRLGLGRVPAGIKKPVTVTRIPADTETFEADIKPRIRGMAPLVSQDDGHNVWMEVLDAKQQVFTPVLLADWGGGWRYRRIC